MNKINVYCVVKVLLYLTLLPAPFNKIYAQIPPIEIFHSIDSISNDNQFMTVNIRLEIKNNGISRLSNVQVVAAEHPDFSFKFIDTPSEYVIGDIQENSSVTFFYELKSSVVYNQNEADSFQYNWELTFGDPGFEEMVFIESNHITQEGAQ